MADVLFDTGKFDLRPDDAGGSSHGSPASSLAHPGLRLEVEGHTDSTGQRRL
jgi:outer membrane protein OmpA-like peptidoglycan-associated protein